MKLAVRIISLTVMPEVCLCGRWEVRGGGECLQRGLLSAVKCFPSSDIEDCSWVHCFMPFLEYYPYQTA